MVEVRNLLFIIIYCIEFWCCVFGVVIFCFVVDVIASHLLLLSFVVDMIGFRWFNILESCFIFCVISLNKG